MPNGTYIDMCSKLPVVDPAAITAATIIMRGEFDGIAGLDDLMNFFARLPNPDKQFTVMPESQCQLQQKNYCSSITSCIRSSRPSRCTRLGDAPRTTRRTMPKWVRVNYQGRECFGTIVDDKIALHAGDMLTDPRSTGESIASSAAKLLTPTTRARWLVWSTTTTRWSPS